MKKLFTLIALLACVLGAKAEWVEDYKIDYSTYTGFPFYVMGYVPEWVDGVMTDMGGNYKYEAVDGATETSDVIVKTNSGVEYYRLPNDGTWHQYFVADGIPTEIDGSYTVKALMRASEPCDVPLQMRWSWGEDPVSASASVGTEWTEVEWEFSGVAGTSCSLIAQPNTAAQIEWKSLTVSHNQKAQRPVEWLPLLTNGDAETAWTEEQAATKFDDMENNYKICAWGKVNQGDPTPAEITGVEEGHAFIVRASDCPDPTVDASAWDNQFWIQAPRQLKAGEQVKIHFRYKASQNAKTNTQIHHQTPSDYMHWQAIGDINFTTEWQEYDQVVSWPNGGDDKGWSIAFNLNPEVKTATDFYFDDLQISEMKLDHGYFVAGSNPDEGLEYDFDNAVEFTPETITAVVVDEDGYEDEITIDAMVATIGEKNAYVSQVMISTVRGNDAAFKSATLKPAGAITNKTWLNYSEGSLAKLNLPGPGVWKIILDPALQKVQFEMIDGTIVEKPEINPNPTVVVVHGQERADKKTGDDDDDPTHTGNDWDNQFFIKANRALAAGEETIVEFDYSSSIAATSGTQCHGETPGAYLHWNCIGSFNFSPEEQHFSTTFTVPSEANEMWCIAFNMAEIKEACDYTIKNIVWKLADGTESLINQTGSDNFYVKEGAGTTPYIFGTDPNGIVNIAADAARNASSAAYNLAGQRVAESYKGIVLKNGHKYIVK